MFRFSHCNQIFTLFQNSRVFPLLAVILVYPLKFAFPSQSEITTLYFYIPETNINNLAILKDQFESYLVKHGNYSFRPFSNQATFERFVKEDKKAVILVSSWYYGKLNERHEVNPVLVGVSGKSSKQKYYLCKKAELSGSSFSGGEKFASASGIDFTREVLQQIVPLKYHKNVALARILLVPKDIDALMAIEFGILNCALTTESGLNQFAHTSPKEYKSLIKLPSQKEWLLPLVAAFEPENISVMALIMLLEKISGDPDGIRSLNMINLDTFKRLNKIHHRILNK